MYELGKAAVLKTILSILMIVLLLIPLSVAGGEPAPRDNGNLSTMTVTAPHGSSGPGAIVDTLVLWNDTLIPGNFIYTATNRSVIPEGIAYDSSNGNLYVANSNTSRTLLVINSSSSRVIDNISVGPGYPFAPVFDSGNGRIFVTNNAGSLNVTVIDSLTDQVAGSVPVGTLTSFAAYDSRDGYTYVTNSTDGLIAIDDATMSVVGSTRVSGFQSGVAYDASNGNVYVPSQAEADLSVVNGTTQTLVTSIEIPGDGIAFDGGNGNLYVSDEACSCLHVVDGSTNTVIKSIPSWVNGPVAYDPANGYVYATYTGTTYSNVTVFNATTNTVVGSMIIGPEPSAITYDGSNGMIYITDQSDGTVSILSPGSGPTLSPVHVSPPSADISPGGKQVFTAIPSCSGACGSNINYSWSLPNDSARDLGRLNTSFGPSVTFTAGNTPGSGTLFVNATLDGVREEAQASIEVPFCSLCNSTHLYLFTPSLLLPLIIMTLGVAVALVAYILRKRKAREPAPSPPPPAGPPPTP